MRLPLSKPILVEPFLMVRPWPKSLTIRGDPPLHELMTSIVLSLKEVVDYIN